MKTYQSFSSEETKNFGERLAESALAAGRIHHRARAAAAAQASALVFALVGDLGAGKTTFIQGFFKGLGLKKRAQSPTFILMRRHALRLHKGAGAFKNVFHVDAYRLKNAKNLEPLGLATIFAGPQNIVLIEWADRVKKILPKDAVWFRFRHGKKESERRIIMER